MNDLEIIKQIEKKLDIQLKPLTKIEYHSIGFTLDSNNNVNGISLWDCKISDKHKIALPLKELKQLTALDLGANPLTDISSLKDLKQLTTLDLSTNQLTDISPLKDLKQLTTLYLIATQLTDISPLKELKQLTTLYLDHNQLTDISLLKELKQLTTLDLGSNPLTDISPLKDLKQLTTLVLGESQLTDISPLKDLKQLTTLDLIATQLTDISPLKDLKQLTTLNLISNPLTDISPLKELKQLTTLGLLFNQIADISPLKELKQLTTLELCFNPLTDISPLKDLKQLTTLDLTNNQLTDISPLKDLKQLTTLDLSTNQLTDISPLKDLKQLTKLRLHYNQITDLSPLKDLKKLAQLNVRENHISELPEWICDFEMEIKWDEFCYSDINFLDNPIVKPPIEIVKRGKSAVANYFKRNRPLNAFISYSKFDGEIKEDGRDYLSDFKKIMFPLIHHKHLLNTWDDTLIKAGEDWDEGIKTGLKTADVIFVLVSKNLISTNYIQETELKIATERQRKGECLVIPIIIKSCSWADIDFFNEKQCIPRKGFTIASFAKNNEWETIDDAWKHVYDEIKESIAKFKEKRNN